MFLSTTLWNREDKICYWARFRNKDIKAQKIWSDLPNVTATGTSAFNSISNTLHCHLVTRPHDGAIALEITI